MSTSPAKKRYSVSRSSACNRCRAARARCSQQRPECTRCVEHNYQCIYERDARQRVDFKESPSSVPSPRQLTTRQELRALIGAYFDHVYNTQAMAFLHRAQLYRQIEQGQIPHQLVKAICGLSARFLPGADNNHLEGGVQAAQWIHDAKIALMTDTNRFSTYKLAAILCIVQHEFNCGRTASAWMFVSMAVRMAFALGLNVEYRGNQLSWIEQEQRRRMMWATYCADAFCSSGWPEYSLLSAEDMHIHLPSDESSYLLGVERKGSSLSNLMESVEANDVDPLINENLTSRWIWLMKLRNDTLKYVRQLNRYPGPIWDPEAPFIEVVRRLRRWKDTLPPSLEFSIDNLYARLTTGELDSFVALHLNFDSIHSTLYRITLPNFTESVPQELLAGAPKEWVDQTRSAAYVRANAVQQKLELLERELPDHVPTTRLFNLYILNSMRVQLQYLALQGITSDPDVQRGLQTMSHIVGKMTGHFYYNRRVVSKARDVADELRDILRILASHGYQIETQWDDVLDPTSGTRTPNDVSGALSGFPNPPAQADKSPPTPVIQLPPDPVPLPELNFPVNTDLFSTSLEALASLPELWNTPNGLDPQADFDLNAILPSRTIAEANTSAWTVDTNFYFWGVNENT